MANDILVQATVIALSLMVSANCLDIDVQPEFVRPSQKDIVATCNYSDGSTKTLEKMLRMRLMKLDDDDKWTEVAVLRLDGSIDLTSVNATAVGRLGNVLESYLVVTWPVAPEDINGRYRCDAIALTNTGDIVKERSRDLDVKSRSDDLLLLLARLKKSERKLVEKVNVTIHRAMKTSKVNLLSALEPKFGDLKKYLDNKTAETSSFRGPEGEEETIQWPEGRFTLLMPSAGCPLYPPEWSKGFVKMKALPGEKYYPLDAPLHLANPHKKDGFIYRQFCMLPRSPERTQPWPKGRYCLRSTGSLPCPTGFKYAECKVKFPDDNGNFYMVYYPNQSPKIGKLGVHAGWFCCRNDGSASSPIDLPVSHPFYLYRHGGRCQEVKGMDVTQDIFIMETVDNVKYDKWFDNNTDFRPDVNFKPYKEDLCYYSRSKV